MSDIRYHLYFGGIFTDELNQWVKHNRRLNRYLPKEPELVRLHITLQDRYATVDLKLFKEAYYKKFIEPSIEAYSIGLLKAMEAPVMRILSRELEPYTIRYEFHYNKGILKKHVTYSFGSMMY